MSGGATFTPRIYPRPTPLSSFKVYSRATLRHIRGPLLAVGVTFATRPLYNQLSNCFHSDRLFFSFSTTLVHFFVYLTVNTFFYLLDRNCWLLHYKLDRKRAQLPSTALMRSTLIEAIVSQLVLGPLLLYCIFPLFKYFGQPGRDQPLPSIMELMRMYVLCVFSNDWGFYWSHRTFHCKAIYKFFHKTHHKYLGTVSFAAEYAHPLEQLFANHLPTAMACLCFGFPIHYGLHGGSKKRMKHIQDIEAAIHHDYHHTANRGNFGALYLDHYFGTMDGFLSLGGEEEYIKKKST